MKKNLIRFSILFFLTVVFLYFFFRGIEWKEVFGYLTDVKLEFFILIILLVPFHFVARAIRWEYLLKHEKKTKFFNRFAGLVVGSTVTFIFPGRLGELARPLYLAQKENMKKGYVIGTVVVERVFDLFTMCAFLGLFLITRPFYSSSFQAKEEVYSNLQFWGSVAIVVASILFLFILGFIFFREKALAIVSFFLKPLSQKTSQKIIEFLEEFVKGLKFFHSAGNLLMYILLSFGVWGSIIFYYWMFLFAYNISVPLFSLIPYTFLIMIGAAIPTPGMAGGFHFFSREGLTSLFSVNLNQAVAMTIVVHAIQLAMTCLIGYVILWKEGISLLQIKKIGEDVES